MNPADDDRMAGVRRNAMILTVLFGAAGTLAVFVGAAAALFVQSPGVRDVRPIVTDRPVDNLASIAAVQGEASLGTPSQAAASGAAASSSTAPTVRASAASQPTSAGQGRNAASGSGSKPSRTAAAGSASSSGARATTTAKTDSATRRHAETAGTSGTRATISSADDGDDHEASDHEVVAPLVRDEEHSSDKARE